jgi:PhoH-like ATPase
LEDYFEHDYKIYTGYKEVVVGQGVINDIYDTSCEITVNDIPELEGEELYPNQFINFKAGEGTKGSALIRYSDKDCPLIALKSKFTDIEKYSITPRNREQIFALNLLLDPSVSIVTLIGPAGSGKTLLALASGLVQSDIFVKKGKKKEDCNLYKKIVISRPIQPMGRDIGFLPGSMQEKMGPWVQPIVDNLEFLFGGDSMVVGDIMESGLVQVEAPTFIRGRTISNAYIIIDEVQNLSRHELKTILTRVGENSKIILTGDIQQIDNKEVDETTNGLTYIVEKFKKYDLSGHITLLKGERSDLATLAAEIL